QAVAEPVAHPPDDRLRGGAVRALEVAVHHELQRRVGRTVDVVLGAEGRSQEIGHGAGDPRVAAPWATSSSSSCCWPSPHSASASPTTPRSRTRSCSSSSAWPSGCCPG